MAGVGLLGLGTVGAAVAELARTNDDVIRRRCGDGVDIRRACVRDIKKVRSAALADLPLTTDADSVIDDPEVDIVVELIGGIDPSKRLLERAIAAGKHVVTANKALLAEHGNGLFRAAEERGVIIAYEAAVAGGIPVVKMAREGLAGNRIRTVAGLINGTCNYILSGMHEGGGDFAAMLARAQEKGYAEADPGFDVEGVDAAHKLTLLASMAFGMPLRYRDVYVEGITEISALDMDCVRQLGYVIRQLGIARRHDDGRVEMRVHPALLPKEHSLSMVRGVLNAVWLEGDAIGRLLCVGSGAGAQPTASAVLADLVDVIRMRSAAPSHRVPSLAFRSDALLDKGVLPMDEVRSCCYLRLNVTDQPGVLATIANLLAKQQISIEAVLQKEMNSVDTPQGKADPSVVPLILLTHEAPERDINRALDEIAKLPVLQAPIMRIRVERDL